MSRRKLSVDFEAVKYEQVERGKRIRYIREDELHLNKSQLAEKIGISSQFLGLVEDGKGNLVYHSIRKLRDLSGHSADYILYGLDNDTISATKELLDNYSEAEIVEALKVIKDISLLIKHK